MKKSIIKFGKYKRLLTSVSGLILSTSVYAAPELVKNGIFYTLQDWKTTSATLMQDLTTSACPQQTASNDAQCPLKGNRRMVCIKSSSRNSLGYVDAYLRQTLTDELQPNTRYRFSFKAIRPTNPSSTNTNPAVLLSSIANSSSWPTGDSTLANWQTLAPAVTYKSNNTLANTSANYNAPGFYHLAQAQTMEFVTPATLAKGEGIPTINFTYSPDLSNADGICITDVSLKKVASVKLNEAKVAVNNYGYLNTSAKRATLSNLPAKASRWQLVSEFEGATIVRLDRPLPSATVDKDSGDKLAIADFSDYSGTSIDPRFRIRVVDNSPHCDVGTFDSANCYVATPPPGTKPFIANNNLYHSAEIGANRCPVTIPGAYFDSANCFVAKPPAGTNPFIYNGSLYYSALPNKSCPLPGSWFDGANCFVATPPPGTSPFIWNGMLYHSQYRDYCSTTNSWFDGANCFVAKTPAGSSPFIYNGNLYVTPSGTGNTLVESELFRINDKKLYTPLKKDALYSFYHQRSNTAIYPMGISRSNLENLIHERGTTNDNSVGCYQGTDLHGNVWPGCPGISFNVQNGWYDAADHGKYVVNGGISLWTLQNLAERLQGKGTLKTAFPTGMLQLPNPFITKYDGSGDYSELLLEARQEMEFMLSMQISTWQNVKMALPVGYQAVAATGLPEKAWDINRPAKGVYQVMKIDGKKQYANNSVEGSIEFNNGKLPSLEIALELTPNIDVGGMVFHSVTDTCWTDIPTDPANYDLDCTTQDLNNPKAYLNDNPNKRVLRYPTTAATLNLAATAAQCYRVWKNIEPGFAQTCLTASKNAWDAAIRIRRQYGDVFRYEYHNTSTTDSWMKTDSSKKNLPSLEHGFALSPNFLGGGNYGDLRLRDEYYWAAMELYLATKDAAYMKHAVSFISTGKQNLTINPLQVGEKDLGDYGQYSVIQDSGFPIYTYDWIHGFNWQNVATLGSISALVADPSTFAQQGNITVEGITKTSPLTNLLSYAAKVMDTQIDRKVGGIRTDSYQIPTIPYSVTSNNSNLPWGSNGEILNRAMILALAADYETDSVRKSEFRRGVTASMNYLLGNNPLQHSYISGYGANALSSPHHRFFAKGKTLGWATVPAGFVAGGPNTRDMGSVAAGATRDADGKINDPSANYFLDITRKQCLVPGKDDGEVYPLRCYTDHYLDFGSNEVAINWQAPLLWVSQYLSE